jgi:PPK2 family polyphosphate:nucleotide phosphotransferase
MRGAQGMSKTSTSCGERFIVTPGKKFSLAHVDPRTKDEFSDKEAAKKGTAEDAEAINLLQDRLYAEGNRALLVVLQATDCSGKDGTVRSVFNTSGPIGVTVTPFKVPSVEERSHDYLWRIHRAIPARGFIGIFNRSHYEDVLVVKVKKLAPEETIERRYHEINEFEKFLHHSGTRILKFMLHISKEEQAERLRDRVKDPTKQWKFNPADLEDRRLWDDFMAAYETAVTRCSTQHAPWYVIPADHNWVRNAAIARIVRETLEDMNPQYPKPDWDPKTVKVV